jgi:hypothetical protein
VKDETPRTCSRITNVDQGEHVIFSEYTVGRLNSGEYGLHAIGSARMKSVRWEEEERLIPQDEDSINSMESIDPSEHARQYANPALSRIKAATIPPQHQTALIYCRVHQSFFL